MAFASSTSLFSSLSLDRISFSSTLDVMHCMVSAACSATRNHLFLWTSPIAVIFPLTLWCPFLHLATLAATLKTSSSLLMVLFRSLRMSVSTSFLIASTRVETNLLTDTLTNRCHSPLFCPLINQSFASMFSSRARLCFADCWLRNLTPSRLEKRIQEHVCALSTCYSAHFICFAPTASYSCFVSDVSS